MVLWPEDTINVSDVDECRPHIRNIVTSTSTSTENSTSLDNLIREAAIQSRAKLISRLAEVDAEMEDLFLNEVEPSSAQILAALRRATLRHEILPVLAGAALKGKGVEPVLDAISHYLPSPLDRMPPALISSYSLSSSTTTKTKRKQQTQKKKLQTTSTDESTDGNIKLGHPLHPSLLAMAFKVVHMKGRGGSGDGRVVFARVYSGKLQTKDTVRCITPSLYNPSISEDHSSSNNNKNTTNGGSKLRQERVGAMLELAGGRFDNLEDGVCRSGEVCALVGLKTVATGDTLLLASEMNNAIDNLVCLAGVASPKPVLTIRLEAESSEQQGKLSKALQCLAVEDPSLRVEETGSATLLSGLGELHMEVTIDRLKRDFGLEGVTFGKPAVSYRETILERIETNGFFKYDRTVGGTRLEASVHLILEPLSSDDGEASDAMESSSTPCRAVTLQDPIVEIGPAARKFMKVDECAPEAELMYLSDVSKGLISGIKGALRRGAIGPFSMGNVKCTVVNVDAEGGIKSLEVLPGAIRAAAANAIAFLLSSSKDFVSVLEPIMALEVTVPGKMVGPILSDLNTRRGSIGEIILGDETTNDPDQAKAIIRGDVPLAEILGYATALRSLTGGEGTFTAEYVGHATCDAPASSF
jgi:elongation factor G